MLIGYARVSTKDQNLDSQILQLHNAGCERIFKDKMSGVKDRQGLIDLLCILRGGDTVIVCRLDRLGRSIIDLIDIAGTIEKKEAQLHSLNEGIDTRTIAGRFIFHVFAALSEFNRNVIRQRTYEGLAAAKLKGNLGGRRQQLKDYEIKQLVLWYQDPYTSLNDICRRVDISRQTLYNYMKKEGVDVVKRKH